MILFFSGCGNSAYVASLLSDTLSDPVVLNIRRSLMKQAHVDEDALRVVWVMPVYSWGLPPVMVDFIKRLEAPGLTDAEHHLVLTCGDDSGLAFKQWRRLMREKGFKAVSTHSVIMPNTYTLMKGFDTDPKAIEDTKLHEAKTRVKAIAADIECARAVDDVTRGSFAWFKSRIIYPWFIRHAMSPTPFHHTDACIGCGKCAMTCPMGNINMKTGSPAWGSNCALCLGCYNICPVHVVEYGNATLGKHQYFNPKINLRNLYK